MPRRCVAVVEVVLLTHLSFFGFSHDADDDDIKLHLIPQMLCINLDDDDSFSHFFSGGEFSVVVDTLRVWTEYVSKGAMSGAGSVYNWLRLFASWLEWTLQFGSLRSTNRLSEGHGEAFVLRELRRDCCEVLIRLSFE